MKTLILLLLTIPTFAQTVETPMEVIRMHYYIDKQKDQQISDLKEARDSLFEIAVRMDERIKSLSASNELSIKKLVDLKDKECELKLNATKPKYWGIGIQIGATYDGQTKPYVGAGVSYNLIRF